MFTNVKIKTSFFSELKGIIFNQKTQNPKFGIVAHEWVKALFVLLELSSEERKNWVNFHFVSSISTDFLTSYLDISVYSKLVKAWEVSCKSLTFTEYHHHK
jgi:hypothetical protein